MKKDSLPAAFLDPNGADVHQQIVEQFTERIAIGLLALKPDDKLPTVAELEGALGISHTTVQRAYKRLESMGATKGKQKGGTRVRNDMSPAEERAIITAFATNRLRPAVQGLRRLGVPRDVVTRAIAAALESAYGAD